MGIPQKPQPYMLFTGLLAGSAEDFARAEEELSTRWGAVELRSEILPFTFTDYYAEEMGDRLLRCFLSFENPVSPGSLPAVKIAANELEARLAGGPGNPRTVNVDPGILDYTRLILATTKDQPHRIYLRDGIWGELTLAYAHGGYQPFPWTYPDYRTEFTQEFFTRVRKAYKRRMSG